MDFLLIAILFIILLAVIFFVCKAIFTAKTHNKLLSLRNKVENASAHVNVQVQRRFDLIPNLVEVVKGASAHEQQTIKNLSLLFEKYSHLNNNAEKLSANDELSKLLNLLYREIEFSTNLKANQNFVLLQKELTEIEEDIVFARQFYNDAVTIYNTAIMSFPNNTVAQKYHFEKENLFDITQCADRVPQIRIAPKQPNEIKCANCGAVLEDGIRYCKYCGTTF